MKKPVAVLAFIAILSSASPSIAVPLPPDSPPPSTDEYTYPARSAQSPNPAGIIPIAAGLGAAVAFTLAGWHMGNIRSVSGNSIAEDFYHGMGTVSYGLAAFTVMSLSLPLIAPPPATPER